MKFKFQRILNYLMIMMLILFSLMTIIESFHKIILSSNVKIVVKTDTVHHDNSIMYINNYTYTLYKHKLKKYKKRKLSDIKKIVIHHSASEHGSIMDFAKMHVDKYDWAGIGYHYVIDSNGTINQTNDIRTISYHVKNDNTASIGICLNGNYDKNKPNYNQIEVLDKLISYIITKQVGKKLKITYHSKINNTKCPGKHMIPHVIKIKQEYEKNNIP